MKINLFIIIFLNLIFSSFGYTKYIIQDGFCDLRNVQNWTNPNDRGVMLCSLESSLREFNRSDTIVDWARGTLNVLALKYPAARALAHHNQLWT